MSWDITFFIPCYNEEPRIRATLQSLKDMMQEKPLSYEMIVVDDCSSDGSVNEIECFQKENPESSVVLIKNEKNQGLGFNYLQTVTQARGRYYMLVNGDNDIPAQYFSDFLSHLGEAEVIIPYVENQVVRPLWRRLFSHAFTALVNLLSGNHIKYYNGPVIHLRETILKFKSETHGFGYQAELLCRALNHELTYIEVPFRCVVHQKEHLPAFRLSNFAAVGGSLLRILKYRFTDSGAAE